MKFTVTMKDPDAAYDSIRDAAKAQLSSVEGITEDEREEMLDGRAEKLSNFANKWMKWGEYITVEFDTEAGTATVVPAK